MKDLIKLRSQLLEILISMKIEVKLKLLKFYNKFNQLKINQIKKEDQGIILFLMCREESSESLTE